MDWEKTIRDMTQKGLILIKQETDGDELVRRLKAAQQRCSQIKLFWLLVLSPEYKYGLPYYVPYQVDGSGSVLCPN